jgi:SET and MYND domain-containing protein
VSPPEEWLEEHAMLRIALARGMAMHGVKGGNFDQDAFTRLDDLTAEWYVGVTSRLHLNSFRCEVPPAEVAAGLKAPTNDCGHMHGNHGDGGEDSCYGHSHSHGVANDVSAASTVVSAPDGGDDESCHGHSHSIQHSHSHSRDITGATAAVAPAADFRATMEAALVASAAGVGTGSALYTLPSMLNHSCDPNVDAVWDGGDATLTLRCRRDVDLGEALTITYIDADSPVVARRQRLHHAYGFMCVCARCVEEAKQAEP